MQRARLIAPLILLAFGLHSCRRTSWKIVAEPAPIHPLLDGAAEAATVGETSSQASGMFEQGKPLGLTLRPSDVGLLEGHLVGAVQVQSLPASGAQASR